MKYCSKCGNELRDDAVFCDKCGSQVGNVESQQRKQIFEGTIHKCPNCGAIVEAFSAKCENCGFEFRDVKPSSTVKKLEEELKEIELSRKKEKNSLTKIIMCTSQFGDNTDKQRINLIRNFPIPNTKEDMFEFMILASSNIILDHYYDSDYEVERKVSAAWMAKMEQVYNKSKVMFGNDPDFIGIKEIYEEKCKAVKDDKHKLYLIIGIVLSISILMLILAAVLPLLYFR